MVTSQYDGGGVCPGRVFACLERPIRLVAPDRERQRKVTATIEENSRLVLSLVTRSGLSILHPQVSPHQSDMRQRADTN